VWKRKMSLERIIQNLLLHFYQNYEFEEGINFHFLFCWLFRELCLCICPFRGNNQHYRSPPQLLAPSIDYDHDRIRMVYAQTHSFNFTIQLYNTYWHQIILNSLFLFLSHRSWKEWMKLINISSKLIHNNNNNNERAMGIGYW